MWTGSELGDIFFLSHILWRVLCVNSILMKSHTHTHAVGPFWTFWGWAQSLSMSRWAGRSQTQGAFLFHQTLLSGATYADSTYISTQTVGWVLVKLRSSHAQILWDLRVCACEQVLLVYVPDHPACRAGEAPVLYRGDEIIRQAQHRHSGKIKNSVTQITYYKMAKIIITYIIGNNS